MEALRSNLEKQFKAKSDAANKIIKSDKPGCVPKDLVQNAISLMEANEEILLKLMSITPIFTEEHEYYMSHLLLTYNQLGAAYKGHLGDDENARKWMQKSLDLCFALCAVSTWYYYMLAATVISLQKTDPHFEDTPHWLRLATYCCDEYLRESPSSPSWVIKEAMSGRVALLAHDLDRDNSKYINKMILKFQATINERYRDYFYTLKQPRVALEHGAKVFQKLTEMSHEIDIEKWCDNVEQTAMIGIETGAFTYIRYLLGLTAKLLETRVHEIWESSLMHHKKIILAAEVNKWNASMSVCWVHYGLQLLREGVDKLALQKRLAPPEMIERSNFYVPIAPYTPIESQFYRLSDRVLSSEKKMEKMIKQIRRIIMEECAEEDRMGKMVILTATELLFNEIRKC